MTGLTQNTAKWHGFRDNEFVNKLLPPYLVKITSSPEKKFRTQKCQRIKLFFTTTTPQSVILASRRQAPDISLHTKITLSREKEKTTNNVAHEPDTSASRGNRLTSFLTKRECPSRYGSLAPRIVLHHWNTLTRLLPRNPTSGMVIT